MLEYKVIRNAEGIITHIETALTGQDLLSVSKLNKGCGFSQEERQTFQLHGLLPQQVETLSQQVARMYAQFHEHKTDLSKNIYLNVLHDYNETLFYHLVSQYLEEMLPIIYTPTIGEAVERFSLEHRKTRGLYLSYPDRDNMHAIIEHQIPQNVHLAVVTDGEAVLGLGDQGIGGINISCGKLMVYTLGAGISPYNVLPIQLDVGTNNPQLLEDPMYLGWRHERITGQIYDDFIDSFVQTITKKFPHIFLHWEDFARDNARRILTRYRQDICTMNGDIQSTATVALACVLAGVQASKIPLHAHRIVIFGAGNAGLGIAEQLIEVFKKSGLDAKEAYARLWLIDKQGLLIKESTALAFQMSYAKSLQELIHWPSEDRQKLGLYEVIKNVKPTILIGCSAVAHAFNEEIVKTMAANTPLPIIMPLSNPTAKSEATPEDLLHWTQGRVLIATGSPFKDIFFQGRSIRIAQSNNSYAFPGIGLGTIAVKAKRLSDGMLDAAMYALSQCSPTLTDPHAPLLPAFAKIHSVSRTIAFAVAEQARAEGLTRIEEHISLQQAMNAVSWEPRYYPYRKI